MKQPRFLAIAILCALPAVSGCAYIVGVNADINDGSVEKMAADDNEARLRRMQESGNLRPGEYEALRSKLGNGGDSDSIPKPTVSDLERRVEESRKAREAGIAQ